MPRKKPERPVLLRAVNNDGRLAVVAITSYRVEPDGTIVPAMTRDVTMEFLRVADETFPVLRREGVLKLAEEAAP